MTIDDHPQRYAMANELHARPFPIVQAPARAAYLALKPAENAAGRDRDADRAHLVELLDRFGAKHPQPGATHYFGQIGRHQLKWESHTEFVTFTIFGDGVAERPFEAETFRLFPEDWLANAPGQRLTSALIRIEEAETDEGIIPKVTDWFVPESLAISRVLDDQLVVAGDFHIDPSGHMRFAVFVRPDTGPQRTGRVIQRLCEIETYKAMSMLGLFMARDIGGKLNGIENKLTELVADMTGPLARPEETLNSLLAISAELETLVAQTSFRFGATGAYETIVNQRIEVLRETRFGGRQTFAEFMMRRFDPAMRTVKSTERRMQAMSDRALRAGDLLRTQVDVARSAQNQSLLESMDRRSDMQLRLQKTVEGLSVVAISYYALNLVLYLLAPFAEGAGLSRTVLGAIAMPLVVIAVALMVRSIRKSVEKG
ncbi:DUF3422 family protein [Histidinibacterium aquaticum]|uniref:DUF3422 domain-containing protein n=1 Tax=Histidinibacterium aquaticum TaxID=2613962 RepID=A0A5J5GCB9_9RHOB|nr:DUF3422 domain-containing protein [Histidinibacterium aquaticum]KAA9005647.1 DUF3422 domain-containing protein [Histidinibacterium aquaticum]